MIRTEQRPVVLCVDDEPAVLAALRRLLRNEPYVVVTVVNPIDALLQIEAGGVDLIIADERMPALSGIELLSAVGVVSPGTSRVLLTGFPEGRLVDSCATLGVERFVSKPWDEMLLKTTIRELVRTGG